MSSNFDRSIDLQNVKPGAVAVLKLSYDATYDRIHLTLSGGLTKANVGRIEGKANGVTFFVDDGALIGVRDAYQGVYVDPNIITIDFTEPNTRGGAAAQYLAALPRNMLASLTFEFEIKTTAAAGSDMKAMTEHRDKTPNPFVLQRKDFNVPLTLVGENDVMLPVMGNGGLIKRIWLHSTGHITAAELRTDGKPRIRASVGELTYQQKRNRLVPQNNLLVLDFIGDGNLMNMLDTSQITEALLRITTDAPDSLKAYIDYVSDIKLLK